MYNSLLVKLDVARSKQQVAVTGDWVYFRRISNNAGNQGALNVLGSIYAAINGGPKFEVTEGFYSKATITLLELWNIAQPSGQVPVLEIMYGTGDFFFAEQRR